MEKLKKNSIIKKFIDFFIDKNVMTWKVGFYDDLVIEYLKEDRIAMDAGCGEGIYGNDWFNYVNPKLLIGIDTSLKSLKNNKLVDLAAKASTKEIPFKNGTFDIIICRSVIEHLPEPKETFKEFYRILKKNGRLIISTQNIYNPIMFINFIIPNSIRIFLKKMIIKTTVDEGTYPAYYRCNSRRQFKNISKQTGFVEEKFIQHTQGHGYWKFSFLKHLFLLLENISLLRFLRFMRPQIVACYIKL